MRASVLFEPGKPLEVEDVDLAPPQEDEVMVQMTASGVCHSCLHTADGSWTGFPMPMVLGDEGAGIVEDVGSGVKHLKPGDHVVLSWAPSCSMCHYCVTGKSHLCERQVPSKGTLFDGTTRMSIKGKPVYHYGPVSSYASHAVVPASCAIPIRNDMPLEKAALIGCSVMTGVGAVMNSAQVPPGASMAVFGVGGIGLNCIQGGALVAANPIIAVDVIDEKLDYAKTLGATHTVNASVDDPVEAIMDITGRGADFAFVAVGVADAIKQGWDCLAPAGMSLIIGLPPTGSTVTFDTASLQANEKMMRGCKYGSARTREDFPRMVELYLSGKLKIDELISKQYDLEEANEAFRALAAGELARGLIVF
ncbi:MAG: Zn-dependent alcohol dehydrogenase [Candidatus Latescibacteria bacterium]|nr:Zn-dependent alcohol dehydrogenase [Candidatus Latescibacterota bacterium]